MTIRRLPEDFLVEEKLGGPFAAGIVDAPSEATPFALIVLRKTSLTTPVAVQGLARELSLRGDAVAYAGLKDRHARTVQHVTARLLGAPDALRAKLASEGLSRGSAEGGSWHAKLIGWSPRPIDAEAIERNRFTIVIRDLARNATHELDRRAHVLREPIPEGAEGADSGRSDSLLVVNYFGDQRFGSARHGGGFAARHLVRGEFEEALRLLVGTPARKDSGATRVMTRAAASDWGDWRKILGVLPRMPERSAFEALAAGRDFRDAFAALPQFTQLMAVEAYQSHLWNAVARSFVMRTTGERERLEADDSFGVMLFPFARSMPDEHRSLRLPLFAPETQFEQPWAEDAAAVLAEEGLSMENLVIPGLRRPFFGESERSLFVRAEGFEQDRPVPDTFDRTGKRFARTLRFSLPRGAYATVVLRALGQ
jgi:tRNA pseudouridine13 synthase